MVDGGLSRRPRYDARTATGHLVTEHVSRFSAEQREGRAGRTRPGICLRLWSAADHELLVDQPAPEIVEGDPLADMTTLQRVAIVIKNGQVEKNVSAITTPLKKP